MVNRRLVLSTRDVWGVQDGVDLTASAGSDRVFPIA